MKRIISLITALTLFCANCNPALAAGPFIWGMDSRAQGLQTSGAVFSNLQTIDADGQRNYIRNNNGLLVTGWIDSGTGTTVTSSSTTSEVPTYPYVDMALKIANDGSGSGYTYYQFQVGPADIARSMGLCWDQKPGAGYTASDYRVEVWADNSSGFGSPVELALTTDSGGNSPLPATTGVYCTGYTTNGTDDFIQVRIVRVAGSSGATIFLAFNNIFSGPGVQPAATAVVSSAANGLWPTALSSLDNTTATKNGIFRYQHGTTYNGGNAPTITLTCGGCGTLSSIAGSSFMPYQDLAGVWHLKGLFNAQLSSLSRGSVTFAIAGVTTAAFNQPCYSTSAGNAQSCFMNTSSGTVSIAHATETNTSYFVGFDVVLTSAPTWAY